jgi:hypothetical protein
MNLTEAQRATVAKWIADGLKLSEIQTRLDKELGLRMTYMEVRFLMDDLKLQPKDQERPPVPPAPAPAGKPASAAPRAPATAAPPPPGDTQGELDPFDEALAELPEEPAAGGGGNVSVTVDQLARPGALASGKVTFSDGKKADWYLDQMGRLGLSPEEAGYRPPAADVSMFQLQLQAALSRAGF